MDEILNPPVDVVVAIVTWRAPKLTIECLESLVGERAAHADLRVVVVDNDSQDGTADAIAAAIESHGWGEWIELIRAPRNGGFAYGNNLVFRHAATRYPQHRFVLLLNPDTVARPGTIRELRDFMVANPEVGIAGGRCEDPDGTPQICSFRFPGVVSEFSSQIRLGLFDELFRRHLVRMGPFERPVEVDWVAGALMIVRREVFDTIGLMDESYFLYYEETDFSLRAQRAGWPTWHVPQARVIHY
ncbi:glycosyltransferase family 2 protein, partial [bacterium]